MTDYESSRAFEETHEHGMHMFVLYERLNRDQLRPEQAGSYALERVKLLCAESECSFRVEIDVLPPRLSAREFNYFVDSRRVTRNLQEARAEDPNRFQDVVDGQDPIFMFLRYLADGLRQQGGEPRQIKKHNKKFMVYFKTDFDDLFRALGFTEKVVDGEEIWAFPAPWAPTSLTAPTVVGTLRAKWEDVSAELLPSTNKDIGTQLLQPAWNHLQRLLGAKYKPITNKRCSDSDMELLGCLDDFPQAVFIWAAKLLAAQCSSRLEEFIHAAVGCVDEPAQVELALFLSQADNATSAPSHFQEGTERLDGAIGQGIIDAFKYFDSTPTKGDDMDYFYARKVLHNEADSSEEGKAKSERNLEIVRKHIENQAQGNVSLEQTGMTLAKALSILGIEGNWSAEMIQDCVNRLFVSDPLRLACSAQYID
jgi:hypothetical protein